MFAISVGFQWHDHAFFFQIKFHAEGRNKATSKSSKVTKPQKVAQFSSLCALLILPMLRLFEMARDALPLHGPDSKEQKVGAWNESKQREL